MKFPFVAIPICLLLCQSHGSAQSKTDPLERCRKMDFSLEGEKFSHGWQERVALDFEFVNEVELSMLRSGLVDDNLFVRALSARALGIRSDKSSIATLASLAQSDPEYLVRVRAVEALGLLKAKPDIVEAAKRDKNGGVRWAADLSADMIKQKDDYGVQMREAYAVGIDLKEMGQAQVGQRAPDFSALTLDGKSFQLSSILGKKPIAIYFAAMDS